MSDQNYLTEYEHPSVGVLFEQHVTQYVYNRRYLLLCYQMSNKEILITVVLKYNVTR